VLNLGKPDHIEFILNGDHSNHDTKLKSLMRTCQHFRCIVAFANLAGFSSFKKELKARLQKGLRARFVIGLDFCHTDPRLLEELLKLSNNHENLDLFISHDEAKWTFHPKLYAFDGESCTDLVVGSANLTAGGLENNHELSILIHHNKNEQFCDHVDSLINKWIRDKEIIRAEKEHIEQYAEKHAIYKAQKALATHRSRYQSKNKKAAQHKNQKADNGGIETLRDCLNEMKRNPTENEFYKQVKNRATHYAKAHELLFKMSQTSVGSAKTFLESYDKLILHWHSGGLHRGKTRITLQRHNFYEALQSLDKLKREPVAKAFDELHAGISKVNGAGVNVITEILHTLDNKKFAVMNQNSVNGVSLVYGKIFPERPSKDSIDGASYAVFCKQAHDICEQLELNDFSELDTLFNYVYWLQKETEA